MQASLFQKVMLEEAWTPKKMAARTFLAVFAVIVSILLSLYYNQPIPEGLPDDAHHGLRTLGASMKLYAFIDKLGVLVGAWDQLDFFRNALEFSAKILFSQDNAVKFQDTQIASVPVRVFRPADSTDNKDKLPAVLFYHGGGWRVGGVVTHAEACQRIAKQAHVVVVSVEYRLSPAHTFPSQFEDCHAVAKALLDEGRVHGIDQNHIVIVGDSAGGNLAVAVAWELRHAKTKLAAQILIYPALQFMDLNLPSYKRHGTRVLDRNSVSRSWSMYLTGSPDMAETFLSGNHSAHLQNSKFASYISDTIVDHGKAKSPHKDIPEEVLSALTNPRVSPLMADDLTGLPPTLLMTCQFDVLKDDGILFKGRLQNAGVQVTHRNYMSYHGVFKLGEKHFPSDEMRRMYSDIVQFLEEINHSV